MLVHMNGQGNHRWAIGDARNLTPLNADHKVTERIHVRIRVIKRKGTEGERREGWQLERGAARESKWIGEGIYRANIYVAGPHGDGGSSNSNNKMVRMRSV